MNKTSDAVYRAAAIVGSMSDLARRLAVRLPTVSQWANGTRPVPVHHCVAIERISAGVITRQDLRPTDYWLLWPDLPAPQHQQAA